MKKYKTIQYKRPNFILFDLAFLAALAIGLYHYAAPEVYRVVNEITYHLEMINRAMEVMPK